MRTVLHHQVVVILCLDDLFQLGNVFMLQASMNFHFPLQEFQVVASEFIEVDHLDGVPLMQFADFHSLIDFATIAFTELILDVVLVLPYPNL